MFYFIFIFIFILSNMTILVLLESPAKAKKVSEFIGNGYIVKSTYGHLRDLPNKQISIDISNNFEPTYTNNFDKEHVISDLKKIYKTCDGILLAADYDREGESIAWHVAEILKVPIGKRKRLLFTEITKKAILDAMKIPTDLDINMFYAQQARRIIDRLIGYKVTPLLWKNIQSSMKKGTSLSAGRVQSVVNKLILEREAEINKFSSNNFFKTTGIFNISKLTLNFELDKKIDSKEKTEKFLEKCANHDFVVNDITKTNSKRSPSSPFITSSLQQEVSNKFKYAPKKTMTIAQKLYENGYITYMRTDSVKISDIIMDDIEKIIKKEYGDKYYKKNEFKNKSKNSQEAHEAIRPCNLGVSDLQTENDPNFEMCDINVYNLIYRRTMASQMSDAKIENQCISSKIDSYTFNCKNQKVIFDGFLKVYKPFNENDDEENSEENKNDLSKLNIKKGDVMNLNEVNSIEKFTKPPNGRFTEASLVKKLEELGVGRPSTYSNMVSVVQDRKYVNKEDIEGVDKTYIKIKLKDFEIEESSDTVKMNSEKQKLVPTDVGKIVNDFLELHFDNIINYNFTCDLEKQLDEVSSGTKDWVSVVRGIYNCFNPIILELSSNNDLYKDKFQKSLGFDPKTKFEIVTYIGKYGPLVQLKNTENMSNSKFAPLGELKMDNVTLKQAIELLKYPYKFCDINKNDVIVAKGKYGLYLKYDGKNINMGETKESELTRKIIKELINRTHNPNPNNSEGKQKQSGIELGENISVKNGKFGAYIQDNGVNVSLKYSKYFKGLNKSHENLTLDECKGIIKEYGDYKKTATSKKKK
jgi:DNA topoisomerase I